MLPFYEEQKKEREREYVCPVVHFMLNRMLESTYIHISQRSPIYGNDYGLESQVSLSGVRVCSPFFALVSSRKSRVSMQVQLLFI
jgi:hypothetical protein